MAKFANLKIKTLIYNLLIASGIISRLLGVLLLTYLSLWLGIVGHDEFPDIGTTASQEIMIVCLQLQNIVLVFELVLFVRQIFIHISKRISIAFFILDGFGVCVAITLMLLLPALIVSHDSTYGYSYDIPTQINEFKTFIYSISAAIFILSIINVARISWISKYNKIEE